MLMLERHVLQVLPATLDMAAMAAGAAAPAAAAHPTGPTKLPLW